MLHPCACTCLSLLVVVVLLVAATAQARAEDAQPLPPKEMRFVRAYLGKRTVMGAGELGQPLTSYYLNIDLGTPPKPFSMLLDVNARENFVPHYSALGLIYSRLNYAQGYSKKDSTTSDKEPLANNNETLTISYGGCALSGKAYTDQLVVRFVLESYKKPEYRQRFLAMSTASNDRFARHSVDGVLALNPWPISATGSELLTVGLARVDLMGELRFGLHLAGAAQEGDLETAGSSASDGDTRGGEITLGRANPTKFLGALRFHKVVAQHAWELALTGVQLGGRSVGGGARPESVALLSTTANGITGPARAVNEILDQLGPMGRLPGDSFLGQRYQIDCEKRAGAPELTFQFEDARYSVPPTAYIKMKPAGTFRRAMCFVEIYASSEQNTDKWELGTNFLAHFYTVFDINARQVALGALHQQKE